MFSYAGSMFKTDDKTGRTGRSKARRRQRAHCFQLEPVRNFVALSITHPPLPEQKNREGTDNEACCSGAAPG